MTEIELLEKIVANTSSNKNLWVAGIAALAVVFGAVVTGFLQYLIEKYRTKRNSDLEEKKLRAGIIVEERLRWLQDIRQRLSKLYTQLDMQYNFLKRPGAPAQLQQILDDYSLIVVEEVHMISLILNPEKADQKKLIRALSVKQKIMIKCFYRKSLGLPQIYDRRYSIVKSSAFNSLTKIGSRTWRQIKNLE